MPKAVAIDNDFINHLLEIKSHPDVISLISNFFLDLDVQPYMHQFVYEKEYLICKNEIKNKVFENNIVSVALIEMFLSKPERKTYYEILVRTIYRGFMGEEYPCEDVLSEWKAQHSLGEVHTVAMCELMGWDCFLSDDNGVASELSQVISEKLTTPICIYNRQLCCKQIKEKKSKGLICKLSSPDLKKINHS